MHGLQYNFDSWDKRPRIALDVRPVGRTFVQLLTVESNHDHDDDDDDDDDEL